MSDAPATEQQVDIHRIVAELFASLIAQGESVARAKNLNWVDVSSTREIPPCSLLRLAKNSRADSKFYWRDRTGTYETVGLGAVCRYTANGSRDLDNMFRNTISHLESADSSTRFFGGFRFDRFDGSTDISREWSEFESGAFVLPLVEISRLDDKYKLTVTVRYEKSQPKLRFEDFSYTNASFDDKIVEAWSPLSWREYPGRADWHKNIDLVSQMIHSKELAKVVLARRVSLDFARPINPFALLERAFAQDDNATLFGYQPSPGVCFIGGTPELLVSRNQRQIYSEAVAGTRRAGGDGKVNSPNWSAKDRREIDFVRDAITERLAEFCASVECPPEPVIHRAGKIEHLRYPVSGILNGDAFQFDILTTLSPTPAVCGSPSESAIRIIRELEPFDRGWYAGPVGWIGKDSAEFAVAIRSALVCGQTVHLYSGAGIVEGSEATAEWDELEAKIATLRSALGA